MFTLKIITASTRPGRKGPIIESWIYELTKKNPAFEVTLLDQDILNLPFFTNHINAQVGFVADDGIKKSANAMLGELAKWAAPLKTMRIK